MEKFVRDRTFCGLLRSNDPRGTSVPKNAAGFFGYPSIGAALRGNTHVTSIDLNLCDLNDYDEYDCPGEDVRSREERLVRQGMESAEHILRHFRESRILRSVGFHDEGDFEPRWSMNIRRPITSRLARPFFQAMTDHQLDNIVELSISRCSYLEESYDLFTYFLQASQVLRKLSLALGRDMRASGRMEEALRSNTSLEYVKLEMELGEAIVDVDAVVGILRQLHTHPRLSILCLSYTTSYGDDDSTAERADEIVEAVSALLVATKSLRDLKLIGLDSHQTQLLVDGLLSNRTLSRLAVGEVDLDIFNEYLRSMVNKPGCLRELRFRNLGSSNTAALAESMVATPESSSQTFRASVGSLLRVLALSTVSSNFLDVYSANAASLRLEKLFIRSLPSQHAGALLRCIPSLVFLKELVIEGGSCGVRDFAIKLYHAGALMRNGSIVKFSLPTWFKSDDAVPSEVVRHFDAFSKRNQNLPTMLSNGTAALSDNGTDHGAKLASDVALFPSLFFAAIPAKRLAPNNLFNGLLSASDDLGPQRGAKRSQS
jgi:hypothetical protein